MQAFRVNSKKTLVFDNDLETCYLVLLKWTNLVGSIQRLDVVLINFARVNVSTRHQLL